MYNYHNEISMHQRFSYFISCFLSVASNIIKFRAKNTWHTLSFNNSTYIFPCKIGRGNLKPYLKAHLLSRGFVITVLVEGTIEVRIK